MEALSTKFKQVLIELKILYYFCNTATFVKSFYYKCMNHKFLGSIFFETLIITINLSSLIFELETLNFPFTV